MFQSRKIEPYFADLPLGVRELTSKEMSEVSGGLSGGGEIITITAHLAEGSSHYRASISAGLSGVNALGLGSIISSGTNFSTTDYVLQDPYGDIDSDGIPNAEDPAPYDSTIVVTAAIPAAYDPVGNGNFYMRDRITGDIFLTPDYQHKIDTDPGINWVGVAADLAVILSGAGAGIAEGIVAQGLSIFGMGSELIKQTSGQPYHSPRNPGGDPPNEP